MSVERLKKAIAEQQMKCPSCGKAIQEFDKYQEMASSVWDGAGDSNLETKGAKVTLICGNDGCAWKERTEFWQSFVD